jgi:hypothetical protein
MIHSYTNLLEKAKSVTRAHHFRFMLFAEVLVEEMHVLRQVECGQVL